MGVRRGRLLVVVVVCLAMPIVAAVPAGASPTLTVSPKAGLMSPTQTVQVSGSGFAAGLTIGLQECVASAHSATGCDFGTQVFEGTSGSFNTSFTAQRFITVGGTPIDCTVSTNACLIGAGTSPSDSAAAKISFASVTPTIIVTPHVNLTDTQTVTVTGKAFTPLAQLDLAECLTGATSTNDCDLTTTLVTTTTTASGTFSVSFTVHRAITINGSLIDCGLAGACIIGAGTSLAETATAPIAFSNAACANAQPCSKSTSAPASTAFPAETITVAGTPTATNATITLSLGSGTLTCPTVTPAVRQIANLTDTGFANTARLTVTAALHLTAATSPDQVCFQSTVPFKSQSNPTIPKAGTGLLLSCTKVANVAPCLSTSAQAGSDVVVTFVVPGGDPRFYFVTPHGRQIWAQTSGQAKVGKTYAAHLLTSGGRRPYHFSVKSGNLPDGLTLNPNSGVITGTPTKKESTSAQIEATDSSMPSQKADLSLTFTIT